MGSRCDFSRWPGTEVTGPLLALIIHTVFAVSSLRLVVARFSSPAASKQSPRAHFARVSERYRVVSTAGWICFTRARGPVWDSGAAPPLGITRIQPDDRGSRAARNLRSQ